MNYLQDVYFTNLNPVFNIGGYFSISETDEWTCGKHRFEQCKFYYVVEGSCVVDIEGTHFEASAGDWLFIPANAEHSYYNCKGERFSKYWIHFDLYPNADIFKYLNLPYLIKVGVKDKVEELFKKLVNSAKTDELADKLAVKACILNLLVEFVKVSRPEGVSVKSREDKRLGDLLRFINENLDKELTIEVLAEKYFAHPNHFIRAFKDQTGQTPAKYIKSKRMETAKRLLESTDLSAAEITERIGINDPAHFSRLFKEYYNMPPARYRQYFKKYLIV
jgi:AraC-like DNA-binding protein